MDEQPESEAHDRRHREDGEERRARNKTRRRRNIPVKAHRDHGRERRHGR